MVRRAMIAPGLTNEQVASVREWASLTPKVLDVRLFGSRAKGTHRADSDVDLAIRLHNDSRGPLWLTFWDHSDEWRDDLARRLGLQIDLQLYDPVEHPTVVAYCRQGHTVLWARTEA